MAEQTYALSASRVIAAAPEDLYDMVADISRMGEWSPNCAGGWYEDGAGPEVGAWFVGRVIDPRAREEGATGQTRSQVVVADRGREFAFATGERPVVRWGSVFTPVDGGTEVTESWAMLPEGITIFEAHFGDDAAKEIVLRQGWARESIPETLAALARVAEAR